MIAYRQLSQNVVNVKKKKKKKVIIDLMVCLPVFITEA